MAEAEVTTSARWPSTCHVCQTVNPDEVMNPAPSVGGALVICRTCGSATQIFAQNSDGRLWHIGIPCDLLAEYWLPERLDRSGVCFTETERLVVQKLKALGLTTRQYIEQWTTWEAATVEPPPRRNFYLYFVAEREGE